jgi:hypothetical protein
MSISAVNGNPWTIPFPSFGSSSPNGSTTGTEAAPDFSVAESQGSSATTAGISTTSGSTLGLPTLLADFQNWLLQMQMQSGTSGTTASASAASGSAAGSSGTGASATGSCGTVGGTDSETASTGGTNGQDGGQRDQAISLLRSIDTELTSINSELQGAGTTSLTG